MSLIRTIYLFVVIINTIHSETLITGTVTVAGLFQIQRAENSKCSGIQPFSVKTVEAVKWTFRKLNENNYIPGVTLGLDVWPTCQLVDVSNDLAIDLINKIREDKNNLTNSNPPLVALIGPGYSSEVQQTSILFSSQRTDDQLLQLGFSATAAVLSDSTVYSNFFRVVPSDETQIEVMISLMKELLWNYIAVIYDNDLYGNEGHRSLVARAADTSICIATSYQIPSGAVSLSELRGILQSIIQHSESPISGVVVFTSPTHVQGIISAATAMKDAFSDPLSFIFSEAIGLSDSYFKDVQGNLYAAAKGVYSVAPPQLLLSEYEDYWSDIFSNVSKLITEATTNDWLRNVYQLYSGCLPSTSPLNPGCPALDSTQMKLVTQRYSWTSYVVKNAYVIAKVLKNIHNKKCPGQQGMCTTMRDTLYKKKGSLVAEMNGLTLNFKTDFPFVPDALSNISFTFPGGNDAKYQEGFPDYEAYQYGMCKSSPGTFCFEKIGSYNNMLLTLDKALIRDYHSNENGNQWPNVNYAQCKEGRRCSSCISKQAYDEIFFKDGDLIIGGIAPVYDGATDNPTSCSVIRKTLGLEIVQAMEYAVELINNKTHPFEHVFPNRSIGFLIINSCDQPLLIKQKLLSILHNGLPLDNGAVLDVKSKLLGFVGAYASSLSIASSDVTSQFGYVQVAYASTAVDLKDRTKFPYFARTSTSDDRQTRAMIQIIKHSHFSSNYIQVIYSKGTYGKAGRDALRIEANAAGVCVANEIEVDDGDNFNAILDKLRVYSFAKIVIVFLRSHQVLDVTSALNSRMQYGEFLYLGSEAWGYRPNDFTTQQKLAGSITLSLEIPKNENFTKYLNGINVLGKSSNPWLMEYIAAKFSCHLTTSFDKTFTQPCDDNLRLADPSSYEQEIWTPFALNAMVATLSGSSEAFRELCGPNHPTLCEQYTKHPLTVRSKIIAQAFDIDGSGNKFRLFDSNGDGNVGYTIYNLQPDVDDSSKIVYKKVGNFPVNGSSFVLDVQKIVLPSGLTLPSRCPNELACTMCKGRSDNTSNSPISVESSDPAVPALGALVGILVVIVVILIVVIVLCHRRIKESQRKQTENYAYLNVADVPDPQFYLQVRNTGHEHQDQFDMRKDSTITQQREPTVTASNLNPSSLLDERSAPPDDEPFSTSAGSNTAPKKLDSSSSLQVEPPDKTRQSPDLPEFSTSAGSNTALKKIESSSSLQVEPSDSTRQSPDLPASMQSFKEANGIDVPLSCIDAIEQHVTKGSPPLAPSNKKTQVAVVSGVRH